MNPEQFVYWLAGYMSGGRSNDTDSIVQDIEEALKKVKVSAAGVFVMSTFSDG